MTIAMTRRDVLKTAGAFAAASATLRADAPASTVAIGRCRTYGSAVEVAMAKLFDQIGGIGSLVKGKTVAVKLNFTGNPAHFPPRASLPYRVHPDTVLALTRLLARAGARRVRLLESFFPAGQDPALWARYGLDLAAVNNAGCKVEWENVQNLGYGKQYARFRVPGGGYIFPSYDLNHSYADCDTFVSLAMLKNHWIGGVTLSLKNCFGNTPCSLYGGDCGASGNENPSQERGPVCHAGVLTPPKGVAQELNPASPRDPGYRVTRITADLAAARPIDLAVIDGVDTIRGGEGDWIHGIQRIHPGVLLAGKNPVCTDAVATAVMGYDPRAARGTKPFLRGDNTMRLAEALGIGTTDLTRIEVTGLSIREALCDFGPGPTGQPI